MPLKEYNSRADYVADGYLTRPERYLGGHPGNRPEIVLSYDRAGMLRHHIQRAQLIVNLMNWTAPGPSIVVVGSGYGWLIEGFEGMGFDRVVGVDTGAYVQSTQNQTEEAIIDAAIQAVGLDPLTGEGAARKALLFDGGAISRTSRGIKNEDLSRSAGWGRIKQALGLQGNTKPDWAVTEDLLSLLSDQEITDAVSAWGGQANNFLHFVATAQPGDGPDPTFNPHTILEWSALMPGHNFIEKQNPTRVIRDGVEVTF